MGERERGQDGGAGGTVALAGGLDAVLQREGTILWGGGAVSLRKTTQNNYTKYI